MSLQENNQRLPAPVLNVESDFEAEISSISNTSPPVATSSPHHVRNSLTYLVDSSWYWYSKVRENSYDNNTFAKYSFDTLETVAKLSQPLTDRLIQKNDYVIDTLDMNLNKVVDKVDGVVLKVNDTFQDIQVRCDNIKNDITNKAIKSKEEATKAVLKPLAISQHIITLPKTWYLQANQIIDPTSASALTLSIDADINIDDTDDTNRLRNDNHIADGDGGDGGDGDDEISTTGLAANIYRHIPPSFLLLASKFYVEFYDNACIAVNAANTVANTTTVEAMKKANETTQKFQSEYLNFVQSMKMKLGAVWSSSIVLAYYTAIQERFHQQSQQLQQE